MVSIIICSISPDKCNISIDNFKETVGCSHEIIIFDNRNTKWGICKVYNHCALQAKGDFLCFIHEDVFLKTMNWGQILEDFYNSNKDCGILGFAGGAYSPRMFMNWYVDIRFENYTFPGERSGILETIKTNPKNELFSKVITLDGFFLFTSRNNWIITKFDENTFDGFHFYDMDFSMCHYLSGRINYVCHIIEATHLSRGTYEKDYFDAAGKFRSKYAKFLPQNISCCFFDRIKMELRSAFLFWMYGKRLFISNKELRKELYKVLKLYRFIYTYIAINIAYIRYKIRKR